MSKNDLKGRDIRAQSLTSGKGCFKIVQGGDCLEFWILLDVHLLV